MQNKRPTALTVYTVLTIISLSYQFLVVIYNLVAGPMTDAEIKEQKLAFLQSVDPEMASESSFELGQMTEVLEITSNNLYTMTAVNFLTVIIGLIAVVLMMRLRKKGFHLYIIYSIVPIAMSTYYFAHLGLGVAGILFNSVFSAIFVALYAFQLKHMK